MSMNTATFTAPATTSASASDTANLDMYDSVMFYGLEFNPFLKSSRKEVIFSYAEYNEVVSRLNFLVQAKGIGLITGAPGVGKSTVIRIWSETLNPADYMVIYTSMTSLTTAEFFRHIASLLGLDPTYRKSDNLAMIKENIESLASSSKKTPVIIIDEANELDTQCINDLKIMMNFNMDSQNKAVLILCGLPDINKRLNLRLLEPVRQRIVTNFKMDGLSKEESAQYINHSLRGAGCMQQNLFTADAVEAITGIADGKPRIINNICAKALIMGGLRKLQQINSEVIRLAHDDMVLE